MSERRDLYQGYVALKGWPAALTDDQATYFDRVIGALGRPGALSILEIGFGGGQFLEWATRRGHRVVGVELIAEMVAAARARGYEAYQTPLSGVAELGRRFDAVVAFDVFEHLGTDELLDMLGELRPLLADGGAVVARFPNGTSALSLPLQSADITHKAVLSVDAFAQICRLGGWEGRELMRDRFLPDRLPVRLKRLVQFALRDLLEFVVSALYFGGQRLNLDPNVIVVATPTGRNRSDGP